MLLLAALNELWHTVGAWHTLHPIPDHPAGQVQVERLPYDVSEAPETNGRCVAWKMLPPHAGAEQVEPPKPGGHAQAEVLIGTP